LKAYEKEGWLKVLKPHWTSAKADAASISAVMKTRQQMNELGYYPDVAPAVLYFLTDRLGEKEISEIQRAIPRKDLVESWKDLEDNAKQLSKRLMGKEAATPSRTWQLLSSARPEMILFLGVTARQQGVQQKIKNFFTKWRQVQQKIPLPEMTELHITPQLPEYPKIANDVFMLLLDGKLRSRTETLKYLKPIAPPPPPPPPPPKRGRGAKAAAAVAAAQAAAAKAAAAKGKGKPAAATAAPAHGKPGATKAAAIAAPAKTAPAKTAPVPALAPPKKVEKAPPAKKARTKQAAAKPASKPRKAAKAKPKKKGK
jgi:hypothetical protein